jgi:hypothetical protein
MTPRQETFRMRGLTRVLSQLAPAAVLATGLLAVGAPTAAQAQFFYHSFQRPFQFYLNYGRPHHHGMPLAEELTPREIMHAVSRYGFRDISRPSYGDDVAIVTATARDGRRLRLEVDVFSGRIVDTFPLRQDRRQLAQRAPDQGAAVRRGVPEQRRDVRTAPETAPASRPPTTVRREPLLPPQPQQTRPAPGTEPRPQPPVARQQPAPGAPAGPRRIDITPPAALDEARPPLPAAPSGPPINSVPPAGLE